MNFKEKLPQNAGNRISEVLDFKFSWGRIPPELPPTSPRFSASVNKTTGSAPDYKAPKAEIPTTMAAMTSTSTVYFDPDLHPDDTLRAFDEFIQNFELRYDAQYPDPPKTSLDAAIERWKLANDDNY